MHPSSCMVGPVQRTTVQFINTTPHYGGATWQRQQMSGGYGQPANFNLIENGLATNRTSNWQNWQSVTPTTTSGQQPNHFSNGNQHKPSLNAHNGQSFLSNGSVPVQNFQPQSSEFNNSSTPNTTIYSKQQDMCQLSTQKQTHVEKPAVSVQNPSLLELYLSNRRSIAASNLNKQLDKPFPVQTTSSHSREELKDYTPNPSNRQMVNNRHDSQTLHQQGLLACAQQPPSYRHAIHAKKPLPNGTQYGVWKNIVQRSNVNQTSAHHQRQVSPAVNVAENIPRPKQGHQIRGSGIGFDSCKSQPGSSSGSSYTGTMHIHNDRMIPQRQSNHNTVRATLNTAFTNLDTPQSLPACSGPPSSASSACNPSATVDNNNPFDKKSFKAIAVVQPLEQECCLNDASKNNSCDAVDASTDKSAPDPQPKTLEMPEDKSSSKVSGVNPSSVTTIPWTIKTLTKLLEDNEMAQQKEVMGLTKVNAFRSICNVTGVQSDLMKLLHLNLRNTAAEFCRRYVTEDSVILTELKGSYGENYCVLEHGELHSEPPYESQWLNVGELDDIDKEFGYAPCLKNGTKKQTDQASEVTGSNAQFLKDDSVKDVTVIEPESTDPGKEKRILNSPESRSSVELTQDQATISIEDSSVDSSDSEFSLEINVLPPDEAKIIYEQIKRKTEEANAIKKLPENDSGSSDHGKLSQGGNVTKSVSDTCVLLSEYCCLPRFFSTFLKNDTSDSKCQCESTSENKQHRHDSDAAPIQKETPNSHNPMLVSLLLQDKEEDLWSYFDKIQSNAKVSCTDAASDSEKTFCNPELKLKDTTSDSPEGAEAQSSFSKMPLLGDLATEVKKGQCEEQHFHPNLKASKKCSNKVDGKPPCSKSQAVVIDLTEDDEPVPSSESPSVGHLQVKDDGSLSGVKIQMNAKADDIVLFSKNDETCNTTSDSLAATEAQSQTSELATSEGSDPKMNICSLQAQSPTSELATSEGSDPKMNSCSLPVNVKSLSPKSPKVPVHPTERESVLSKEKVVKLRLFGSGCSKKMTVTKRPPKVLSVRLSSLKDGPSKPTPTQEQSAKERVYENWKTSIVPVLAVGKKKEGTRKGSPILGVDRKRTVFASSTVAENVPIRSDSWFCKRKQNEMIGLKLKRRKLCSPAKSVKWKGGSASAAQDRDGAAVPHQEIVDRRFRIPSTF